MSGNIFGHGDTEFTKNFLKMAYFSDNDRINYKQLYESIFEIRPAEITP